MCFKISLSAHNFEKESLYSLLKINPKRKTKIATERQMTKGKSETKIKKKDTVVFEAVESRLRVDFGPVTREYL